MTLTVLKVGGSLASYPEKLRALCLKLCEVSKRHALILVPGGGEFADVVRNIDKRFNLSVEASHHMAILGMDQFGLLLGDLIPGSFIVHTLRGAENASALGKLPVFLPSRLMLSEDPLENSWHVTSDSIAAYIAHRLQAKKLLLVTDVDGIYTCDPNEKDSGAKLIEKLSARELLLEGRRTSVDAFLPKLLLEWKLDCYVVSGLFAERVEAVLDGQHTVSTLIF